MSKKKGIKTDNTEETTDFDVIFVSNTDDTTVVTSRGDLKEQKLQLAVNQYRADNSNYSAYLNEGLSPSKTLSMEEIDNLTTNAQNSLSKVMKINAYNHKLVNKSDIVGKTVESIHTNINTEVKITYGKAEEGRNKKKQYNECKRLIDKVNDSIKIKQLVRNGITDTYIDGNWIAYLRHENPNNYTVDVYPLGVCEIADWDINGEPVILFNINNLRNRLTKTYEKNKKNQPLFFANMEEEVKANYPQEVYEAFIKKEKYAILDHKYTGVIRYNNFGRKYGVSCITRAYADLNMLDTFADADRINSKAKAKKIIHQKMRKEVLGTDYNKDYFGELEYAHGNFMASWKQSTVVVTSPPTVEEIKYVEPQVEMTSKDTYNIYRAKVLSTLGIQFLMDSDSQSVSTASISVTQLMRTINSMSEQFEENVLKKWYKQILIDNGFFKEYAPNVNIIDTEQLEQAIKNDMAAFCYSTLNASLETCYNLVGLDIKDEYEKRLSEKELGYEEIFTPRMTAYTNSGDDSNTTKKEGGRPSGDSKNVETNGKQGYDKQYNKVARKK